jgi:hypothetical protein
MTTRELIELLWDYPRNTEVEIVVVGEQSEQHFEVYDVAYNKAAQNLWIYGEPN